MHSMRKLIHLVEGSLLTEWGKVVPGVNTSCDVGPGEINRQASKFGNRLGADGAPPMFSSSTGVEEIDTEESTESGADEARSPVPQEPMEKRYRGLFMKDKPATERRRKT